LIYLFEREEVFLNTKNLRGDRVKVTFITYNTEVHPVIRVMLSPDQRLIFVRRQTKTTGGLQAIFGKNPNSFPDIDKITKCPKCNTYTEIKNIPYPIQFPNKTVVIVGWQENINGKNVQAINYILADGSIELAGQWGSDAIHKEAHAYIPPEPPEEKK